MVAYQRLNHYDRAAYQVKGQQSVLILVELYKVFIGSLDPLVARCYVKFDELFSKMFNVYAL